MALTAVGMKGAHVLTHRRVTFDKVRWEELQPKVHHASAKPPARSAPASFDEKIGRVPGAVEADSLAVVRATSGRTDTQKMARFKTGRWRGGEQLLWTGALPGDRLELTFAVPSDATHEEIAALALAHDYAVVQPALDGQLVGEPLDLYNYTDVISSSELTLATRKLAAGQRRLTFEINGANPSALKAYMAGLDHLRLVPR
jgi:hypothetical protein